MFRKVQVLGSLAGMVAGLVIAMGIAILLRLPLGLGFLR